MKITLVCGFFESTLQSFRENQFAKRLPKAGHRVKVITSTESSVWRYNRAGVAQTEPAALDNEYHLIEGLSLERRKPYARAGDLVLFPLRTDDFLDADVVHVLDFRQGITALAARQAARLGKPVMYDHEQRGDRAGSPIHHIDNALRRAFIRLGAPHVGAVRHTVQANRAFFERVSGLKSPPPFHLSSLGVDEAIFQYDDALRAVTRRELGLQETEFTWLMSGKIDMDKRPNEVAAAVQRVSGTLLVAGKLSERAHASLAEFSCVRILGPMSQARLNALYNAVDACIFTTFTLSYWEALAARARIVVPRTSFSEPILAHRSGVHLFGSADMFEVEEERYRPAAPLADYLEPVLRSVLMLGRPASGIEWLTWSHKIAELESQYCELLKARSE